MRVIVIAVVVVGIGCGKHHDAPAGESVGSGRAVTERGGGSTAPAPNTNTNTNATVSGPAAALAPPSMPTGDERIWRDRCFSSARERHPWDPRDLDAARTAAAQAVQSGAPAIAAPLDVSDVPASEAQAREVVALAARGKLADATARVAALPAMWDVMVDADDDRVPRWFGSAALAACVAVAPESISRSAEAAALVAAAEQLTTQVTADWRRDREWRAIAIAWARIGQPERALVAAAHMPGDRRAAVLSVIVGTLDLGMPTERLAKLEAGATAALAATDTTVFVLPDPSGAVPPQQLQDFAHQASAAEVVAAMVLTRGRRGELDIAAARLATIPTNFTVHGRADGYYACGLAHAGKARTDPPPSGPFVIGLIGAGCAGIVRVPARTLSAPVAREVIDSAIEHGAPEVAASVFAGHREQWENVPQLDELCTVVAALRDANPADAAALVRAQPDARYPLAQKQLVTCGLLIVPALVAAGKRDDARALNDAMLARMPTY